MAQINFGYFDSEFIENVGQITRRLHDLDRIFNSEVPNNFEYLSLLQKLQDDVQKALKAKTELCDGVTDFIQDFQKTEQLNMQIINDLSLEKTKMKSYEAKELESVEKYEIQANESMKKAYNATKDEMKKASERSKKEPAKIKEGTIKGTVRNIKEKVTDIGVSVGEGVSEAYGEVKDRWWTLAGDILRGDFKAAAKDIKEDVKAAAANTVNSTVAVTKGILGFGENIVDFAGTIYLNKYASWAKLVGLEEETDEFTSASMNFIATDWVDKGADALYETKAGKLVNANAFKSMQNEAAMYNVSEMAGGMVPFIVAELATGGSATAATAIMQGASTGGEFAQENMQYKRVNSLEGTKYLYEHNEISKEEYNSTMEAYQIYKSSGMNEEEWQSTLDVAYQSGAIDESTYYTYAKVASMTGEWTTTENLSRTANGAAVVAVIDAGAAYTGAKLNKWAGFGSRKVVNTIAGEVTEVASQKVSERLLTSATRVAIDSGLGFLNPIYQAFGDTIANDEEFSKAYERRGGIEASKKMAMFAGSLSAASEIGNIIKEPKLENGQYYVDDIEKNNVHKNTANKSGEMEKVALGKESKANVKSRKKEKYVMKQKEKYASMITEKQDFTKAYEKAVKDGNLDILQDLINETGTGKDFVRSLTESDMLAYILEHSENEKARLIEFSDRVCEDYIESIYGKELGDKIRSLRLEDDIGIFGLRQIVEACTDGNVSAEVLRAEGKNISKFLDIFDDDNYYYGIHRTGGSVTGETVAKNGLMLTGDISSGIESGFTDVSQREIMIRLEDNITFMDDRGKILNQIKGAGDYKNYLAGDVDVVIVAIPKKLDENGMRNLIIKNGNDAILNPEYIVGYTTVEHETGTISKVVNKNATKNKGLTKIGAEGLFKKGNLNGKTIRRDDFKNLYHYSYIDEAGTKRYVKPFSKEFFEAAQNNRKLTKEGTAKYFEMKEALSSKYGEADAKKIINVYTKISNFEKAGEVGITYVGEFPSMEVKMINPTDFKKAIKEGVEIKRCGSNAYHELIQQIMDECHVSKIEAEQLFDSYYFKDQIDPVIKTKGDVFIKQYESKFKSDYTRKMIKRQVDKGYIDESSDVLKYIDEYEKINKRIKKHKKWTKGYVDPMDVQRAYEKININLTREEATEIWAHFHNGERQMVPGWYQVRTGEIFYCADNGASDVAVQHEVNHALGSVRKINERRGIDEALTESFAQDIMGTDRTKMSYMQLGRMVKDIDDILDTKGLGDASKRAYYGRNIKIYQEAVDSIAGQGYFDSMADAIEVYHKVVCDYLDGRTTLEKLYSAQAEVDFMIHKLRRLAEKN